jgi:hypothetical protein
MNDAKAADKTEDREVSDKMSQHPKYSDAQAELQRENGLVYLFMFKQCRH